MKRDKKKIGVGNSVKVKVGDIDEKIREGKKKDEEGASCLYVSQNVAAVNNIRGVH